MNRYEVINEQGVCCKESTLAAALSIATRKRATGEVAVVHDTATGQVQCRDCGRFSCNC